MSKPVDIHPAQFFDFIGAPGPAVVFVSAHPLHSFNRALARRLADAQGDGIRLGAVGLLDLLLSASPAVTYLHQGLVSCGVSTPLAVMPGYYLFHHGEILGWDPALPNRNDAAPIARGSLLGMIAFAFSRDIGFLGKAFRMAIDEAAAVRVTIHFRTRIEEAHTQEPKHRDGSFGRPPANSGDELSRAYRTLGLSPQATMKEVEAAWRNLRVEFHPDRAAGDPAEFERRGQFAAQLNWARDTIRARRARTA